jgi:Ser/Thr protein kinase RdoA (MazF antagonist)
MIDAAAIADVYAIGEILKFELIARIANDLVRVETASGALWLKLASRSGRTVDELEAEADVVACLGRAKISVTQPVRRADGRYAGPVIDFPSIMFREARGIPITSPSREQAHALGALIANLHLASCSVANRWTIDANSLFHEPLSWLGQRCPVAIASIGTEMIAKLASTLPIGLCHGDLHLENVHFDGDAPTLLDFEVCGTGPLVYDLACYWRKHVSDWEPFLAGYTSVRPLTSEERRAIPVLATLRAIWTMALPAAPNATWGRDWLDAEYFEAHLQMIRALRTRGFE